MPNNNLLPLVKSKTSTKFEFSGVNIFVKDPANAGLFIEDNLGFPVARHHNYLGGYTVFLSITDLATINLRTFSSEPCLPISFNFKPIYTTYQNAVLDLEEAGVIRSTVEGFQNLTDYPRQRVPLDVSEIFFLENFKISEEIYNTKEALFKKYGLQGDTSSFYHDVTKYSLLKCFLGEIELKLPNLDEGIKLFKDILGYPIIDSVSKDGHLKIATFLVDQATNLKFSLHEFSFEDLSHDLRKNVCFIFQTGLKPGELKEFLCDHYADYFIPEEKIKALEGIEAIDKWQLDLNGLQFLLVSTDGRG